MLGAMTWDTVALDQSTMQPRLSHELQGGDRYADWDSRSVSWFILQAVSTQMVTVTGRPGKWVS